VPAPHDAAPGVTFLPVAGVPGFAPGFAGVVVAGFASVGFASPPAGVAVVVAAAPPAAPVVGVVAVVGVVGVAAVVPLLVSPGFAEQAA